MRKLLLLILLCTLLSACNKQQIYSEFHSINQHGWHADSLMGYTIDISDSTAQYEVLITLRHTTQYPYQNLWLFVGEQYGNMPLHSDTIECFLADNHGKWLGKGISKYTMLMLFDDAHIFSHTGEYTFTIQQGMRTDYLQGITDIGLQIIKHNGKE